MLLESLRSSVMWAAVVSGFVLVVSLGGVSVFARCFFLPSALGLCVFCRSHVFPLQEVCSPVLLKDGCGVGVGLLVCASGGASVETPSSSFPATL